MFPHNPRKEKKKTVEVSNTAGDDDDNDDNNSYIVENKKGKAATMTTAPHPPPHPAGLYSILASVVLETAGATPDGKHTVVQISKNNIATGR